MKLRYLAPITFVLSALFFLLDILSPLELLTDGLYLLLAAAFPFFSRHTLWSWVVIIWCTFLIVLGLAVDPGFEWGTPVATMAIANHLILLMSMWCITGLMLYIVRVQRLLAERETELRRHMVDMAHTNRLSTVGQMVVELTHEINQPLYAISNFATACTAMLQDNSRDSREQSQKWIGQIGEQSRRAGEIIRRLRRFVQSDSHTRAPADLGEIVGDVIELLEMDPRLRGVQIHTIRPAELRPIDVDRVQIEQVLVNLVINAAEAMQETPAELRQITVATRTENDHIEVAVRDAGCGMPQDAADRLFEPYFSTKPDGMGLGLPISRSLIEDHGGRMWGEANSDRGLTIRFTLPISTSEKTTVHKALQPKTERALA